jgi:hypothetical protein
MRGGGDGHFQPARRDLACASSWKAGHHREPKHQKRFSNLQTPRLKYTGMQFIDDNPSTCLVCDKSSMLENCATGGPSVIICDRCGCDFHFDCPGLSAVPDGDYFCNLCSLPNPPLTLELEERAIADMRASDRTYRTPPLHTMRLLNALTK